ncbi:uncharacterized protein NDAI_0H02140 [Naumovozyma dairenensis CBS 421]|uniref:Cell wall protein CWP1 n=1 Tax=Naumovozyma dairenensis (strain ATCC 10597 / BCRC 20456 / CBS 421 / NBRC 0211 / NRRL Y-12639) TaxID=1071378 RepID=G0WF27_NAUDC|nr:hypothetical protein NDAI_0H02140 [Naumovozyma dairenensis CBS 421]CCD26388.1 hypothetical protein NDAI_0H02140 [Naumovozyma dairenensis CBS 421]
MQFSTAFYISLLALAKFVIADSASFGMVVIRSGSSLQYASVYAKDGKLAIGQESGNTFSGVVTDAGKLKLSDNKYAIEQTDGSFNEGSEEEGSTGFSVSSGYLSYKSSAFYAVGSGSDYTLSIKEASGSTPIALSARSADGSVVPDFEPSGSSSSEASKSTSAAASASARTTTSAAASAKTTTSAAASKGNVAAISQITDGQIQATISQHTENGAAKSVVGLGAGIVAAAAAMLL